MEKEHDRNSTEDILNRLEQIEQSFGKTMDRIMQLTDKQTELHFQEREKENKRRHLRVVICCAIVCTSIIIYQINYMDYNSRMNELYFNKIKILEERVNQCEKGYFEDSGKNQKLDLPSLIRESDRAVIQVDDGNEY